MKPRRPPVSVLMPFAGSREQAVDALTALAEIALGPDDEIVIADNSTASVMLEFSTEKLRVILAADERSSYYARNVAAAHSRGTWMLFLDADCRPASDVLDQYFAQPISEHEGALGGGLVGETSERSSLARYLTARGHLSPSIGANHPHRPYAVTANLLVRRAAFDSVGGFLEGVRSGADTEFCWRLQEAGWDLGYRTGAAVVHPHREKLRPFLRVSARYAAGRAWLERRYPGSFPDQPGARAALRALAAALRWAFAGRLDRAQERAIDVLVILADLATLVSNRPPGTSTKVAPARLAVLLDRFPELSETFVVAELRALRRQGYSLRVEASRRAVRQDLAAAREFAPCYQEDDSKVGRLADFFWLLCSHPVRCAADTAALRRLRREEPAPPLHVIAPLARRLVRSGATQLHVHFAAGAALSAMRLKRILGLPYTLTAHAYDIFREPTNLLEKLSEADLVTSGCAYNVRHLRALVGNRRGHRVQEVVMGVDVRRFRRVGPYPGGRTVIAVGRLVEKKGFHHLLEAAALLERSSPLERLVIIGDGPERARLAQLAEQLGLEHRLLLRGAISHDQVRHELERADLLVMPSVVTADGDRDSMPVVVKEAMALELPVVASDEVGLPELVRSGWGRLAKPGDATSLAQAIEALLALPRAKREAMGLAGRKFVSEHCDSERETEKLASMLSLRADPQSTNIR